MRPQDAVRLVALGAIWGSSYFFIKVALESYTTIQIVGIRLLIGSLVMFAFMRLRKLSLPRGRGVWWNLLFMSVVGNVIPFLLITWGEESVTSSLTGILNSTTPLFTLLFAALLIAEENLRPLRLAGIALGFVGVAVIVGTDIEGSEVTGQIAIVVAAMTYGSAFVWARRRLTGHPALSLSAAQLTLSTAIMLVPTVLSLVTDPPTISANETFSLAALGALGTGAAFALYYRLIADVGPTTASFVTYLIPIFSVALGRFVLDERLGWNALVGAVLVIAGIALAERSVVAQRRARAPASGTSA